MLRHLFFTALALFAGSCFASDDYVHKPTKVKLPARINEFVRGEPKDFDSVQPGQGVGVPYEWPGTYTSTLFIYTVGASSSTPLSIESAAVAAERDHAVEDLLAVARSRAPIATSANARKSFSLTWQAPTSPDKTPVLWDQFIVYIDGRATNDTLFIWVAKGHIWKARLTRVPGTPAPSIVPFVTSLVQLSISD